VGRGMEDLDRKLNKYGELLPEIMERMERELAGDALTLWSGFAAFCAERMGVAAEKILVATLQEGPGEEAVGRVEGLKDRAERLGLEADEESVEEIRKSLAEAWRVVEERGV
jgi:HEPN domain-containing protein